MKTKLSILISLLVLTMFVSCKKTSTYQVASPDGQTEIVFSLDGNGTPTYWVKKQGHTVILPSTLGLQIKEGNYANQQAVKDVAYDSHDETWQPVWGEEASIRDQHNEMRVVLSAYTIVFRAFNDGIAFRYELPAEAGELTVMDELTEYRLADDPEGWWIPWNVKYYESLFTKTRLSELQDSVSSPLTLELSDGKYMMLHEANLTDYPAQNFYVQDGVVKTYLTPWSTGEKAFLQAGAVTPWRFVILADNLPDFVANRIMLNLNEPCKIEDTSWIQPMKYIGIWWGMHMDLFTWCQGPIHGATTANTKRYIDFAAAHNMKGVLVEGWNWGWDGDWSANGCLFNFSKPYPDYDIEALSKYAAAKGVKIIGHNETGGCTVNYENQLDDAFSFFNKYGIADVKTGYVNAVLDGKEYHKSQYGVRHMRKVIETAAKYHITIDNHEPVMPTGLQRTYPNLVSGEGVRGAEWDAWSTDGGSPAEHMTVIPFTRCMAGPVDFTFGTFNFENRVHPQTRVHSTIAKQLGLYVVIYSPIQMASDLPENYEGKPAFKFIEDVPVDWQKSILLDAKIGDYVLYARQDKHSDDWYVGGITDENPRELLVDFSFLDANKIYRAEIYRDTEESGWDTNPYAIAIETELVDANTRKAFHLGAGGGFALRLIPTE